MLPCSSKPFAPTDQVAVDYIMGHDRCFFARKNFEPQGFNWLPQVRLEIQILAE